MNNKNTKRALLTSVLSLAVCGSMLVGTTFAWFTDSVSSTNNVITTGNLDVELQYAFAEETTTTLDDLQWQNVDPDQPLLDGTALWEPGYTYVVYLRVVNEGSLALKYSYNINVSETTGTNVNGEELQLSKYIKGRILDSSELEVKDIANAREEYRYYTVFAGSEYEQQVDLAKTLSDETWYQTMPGTVKDVELDAKTTGAPTAMILWMPEEVGNEANYKKSEDVNDPDKYKPSINLGINLLATQASVESDSFGKDYDKDAVYGTQIEVGSEEDLLSVLKNAKANEPLNIKLTSDVEYVTGPSNGYANVTAASSVTIDGQGKYKLVAVGSGVTAIGDDTASLTLKNLTVVDNSVSYAENAWEFGYLEIGGVELVCENVTFTDPIMVDADKATFNNCSFVGYTDKGEVNGKAYTMTMYGVWQYNGSATYTNCTFTGTRGMKICDQYSGGEVSTVVIDGCTFENLSEKPGVAIDDRDTQDMNITIKNSTFINCQAGDQELYIYETDNTVPMLENNTVLNGVQYVSTADELKALGGTNVEGTIILTDDIDMNGDSLASIGVTYNKELTVIGNGHKISNVQLVTGGQNGMKNIGMFYVETGATLKISDLIIDGATIADGIDEYTIGAAVVVGYANGESVVELNNVDVVNVSVTNTKGNAAIYVGYTVSKVTMTSCDVSNSVAAGEVENDKVRADKTGAYIGTANTASCVVTVTNCTNNTNLTACGRVINGASAMYN